MCVCVRVRAGWVVPQKIKVRKALIFVRLERLFEALKRIKNQWSLQCFCNFRILRKLTFYTLKISWKNILNRPQNGLTSPSKFDPKLLFKFDFKNIWKIGLRFYFVYFFLKSSMLLHLDWTRLAKFVPYIENTNIHTQIYQKYYCKCFNEKYFCSNYKPLCCKPDELYCGFNVN